MARIDFNTLTTFAIASKIKKNIVTVIVVGKRKKAIINLTDKADCTSSTVRLYVSLQTQTRIFVHKIFTCSVI